MCLSSCCCVGDASTDNYEDLLHKGRRSCTDCSFLVLFLIFCGGLGCIAWYALEHGDSYRIIFGFIFPLNASRAFDTIWACVHQCPDPDCYNIQRDLMSWQWTIITVYALIMTRR
ncbi:hypothetical protein COOONC_12301 [Cooperia oncophora]